MHTSHVSRQVLARFLPDTATLRRLEQEDTALLRELYANNHIIVSAAPRQLPIDLRLLTKKQTLTIPIDHTHSITIDGQKRPLVLVMATDTASSHGEMSSMLYLRDHIQTARAYMELYLHNPQTYSDEGISGRNLLISALHLMSTPAQLDRFRTIIQKGSAASQEEWPHISLWLDDLEGEKLNGWRNKQDSFQMLAHLALDAIERGFLPIDNLLPSHKTFLSLVVPLLKSVGFPHYENSGSWEEITAVRTSVMAIETALLHKIKALSLHHHFLSRNTSAFEETVDTLLRDGLIELGRRLPNESPEYPKDSVKYRTADAALTYVLLYGLPQLLAKAQVPVAGAVRCIQEIETIVLASLETLDDPLTGGIVRYRGDSYQRVNFHTNAVQSTVRGIKAFIKDKTRNDLVNLDLKQSLRNEYMPAGREAAWTHPLGQIAAWAAKRSLESTDAEDKHYYQEVRDTFLHRMMGTITSDNQWNTTLSSKGEYVVRKVTPWRLPECYIAYQLPGKEPLIVPSPHTPLNWSTASLKEAIGLTVSPEATA